MYRGKSLTSQALTEAACTSAQAARNDRTGTPEAITAPEIPVHPFTSTEVEAI
jgi:hypothetical protein